MKVILKLLKYPLQISITGVDRLRKYSRKNHIL